MNRLLPLLLLVLAIGAGAWLLLSDPEPAAPERGPSASEEESALPDAADPGPALPEPAEASAPLGETGERVSIAPAAPELDAPAAFEASSAEADALLIRVVAPDGETPVPNAVVFHADGREIDEEEAFRALRQMEDVGGVLERLSRRFRTDTKGEVRVPFAEYGLVVGARTERWFHFEMLEDPEPGGEFVLVLQPRSQVQAQVFGPDGRPVAGVPVALTIKFGSFAQPMMTVKTKGKDGIATIRDFAPLVQMGPMEAAGVELALALPLTEPVAEPVDVDELEEEPYLLELPATGEVVVEVLDWAGEPVDQEVDVLLGAVPEGNDFRISFSGPAMPGAGQAIVALVDGEARFPFVGLGMELQASVKLADYPEALTVLSMGPAVAGQSVRLLIQPNAPSTVLTGRAVDAEGEAMVETKLSLVFSEETEHGENSDWSDLKTDSKGRFRYAIGAPGDTAVVSRSLELRVPGKEWGESLAMTRIELALAYPPGEHPLGDVMLSELPVLAAGTVIGPGGEPVAAASVGLQHKVSYGSGANEFYWNSDWRVRTSTDENGEFVLRGVPEDVDAEEFQVQAHRDGYLPGEEPMLRGQTGLVVRLEAGGSLSGKLVVDEGIDLEDLEVQFVTETEGGGTNRHSANLDEDGSFEWDSLQQGSGRVEVAPNRDEEAAFVADGVLIVAGENHDPRLEPIDLRGVLRAVKLRFVDEDGDAVKQVMLTGLDEESRFWEHTWDGQITLFTTKDALDVACSSDGFQTVELRDLRRNSEVVMRRSAEILFVLAEPVDLPEGTLLSVQLVKTGSRRWWGGNEPGEFNELGEARTHAPSAGELDIHIGLVRREGNSTHSSMLSGASSPAKLTIQDPTVSQTFTIRIDQALVDERLQNF